jgi:hypothetical protein
MHRIVQCQFKRLSHDGGLPEKAISRNQAAAFGFAVRFALCSRQERLRGSSR